MSKNGISKGWNAFTGLFKRSSTCFVAGTLVLTGCGPCPIETIESGDTVLAYDFTSQEWLPASVEKPLVHDYDGLIYTITVAGEIIEVTAGHPFWVVDGAELALRPESGHVYENERGMVCAGRWVDSQDLRIGDKLLLTDNSSPAITALSSRPAKLKVYNLAVVQYHNYAVTASGVLVHNKDGVFWKASSFDGQKVYQRNDLIDLNIFDARGRSNLQRMEKGLAPIGPDGKSMNLHHSLQTNDSALFEMTQTFHQQNSKIIH
ncbi:MAG: hypothetical protein JW745_09560, partial [Sedimentisphaerales bacterium]|nr:hypothetical protein [Sedimentisphaerales bacterium]